MSKPILALLTLFVLCSPVFGIEPDEAMRSKLAHHFREQLAKGEPIEPPKLDLLATPKTGDFGWMNKEKGASVLQKLDEDEALIFLDFTISTYSSSGSINGFAIAAGRQPSASVSTRVERRGPFHFKGNVLKGLADNAEFPMVGVFAVKNSAEYMAVSGAMQTVPSIVQVDGLTVPNAPSQIDPPVRTWKDKTGKHSTDAKFVAFKSGKVSIEKLDGKVVELSLDQLSDDDQKHVRALIKADKDYEQMLKRKRATGR